VLFPKSWLRIEMVEQFLGFMGVSQNISVGKTEGERGDLPFPSQPYFPNSARRVKQT